VESAIKEALLGAMIDTAHGEVAGAIKSIEYDFLAHKLAHALAGCAAGAAAGNTCKDGAIGAAVGEMVAGLFTKPGAYASKAEWDAFDAKVLAYSKLIAGGIAAYAGGNAQTAITTAETAVRNNFLTFDENQLRKQAADACKKGNAQACADEKRWDQIDTNRDEKVRQVCAAAPASQTCQEWRDFALLARNSYDGKTSDKLAISDLLKWQQRGISDIQELQSIQKLVATTPYAYNLSADPAVVALANLILDLTPIVGDAKAFYEAKTPFDYALAMVGALGPVGDGAAKALKAAKVAHEAGNVAEAEAQIANAAKLIEASTGRKGSWSVAINGSLEERAAYKLSNGHVYRTDSLGRVSEVEADLAKVRMDRNPYQQCVTGKCGEIGDQGGHLIAATLGGAGDRINLVPQAAILNQGPWKAMENEFRKALEAGKEVKVKIEVGYPSGGGVRPNSFKVTAVVDGATIKRTFTQ
jgi:hypothetical protein